MAPPHSASPSTVSETMRKVMFEAASADDLCVFKALVTVVDDGKGRPKEAIGVLRSEDVEGLDGLGVLHVAAFKGSLKVCRYLTEELHFDVNEVDRQGRTPLFLAVLCKGVDTAKYLLAQGADPNKCNSDGLFPLHSAAGSGHTEAVKLLLEHSASVDAVAICGTPLHCAAVKDHDGTMQILLDYNADSNKIVNGKTPLAAAREADSVNCVLLLSREEASKKVTEGTGHTKKRPFKAEGTKDNVVLDSEIFSQRFGDFPEEIFQCQRAFKRPRVEISELGPDTAESIVMLQGFAQSVSKKSKKVVLVVLRDGPRTVKCVVSRDTVGVTDQMMSYAGKLDRESYVEVHGVVRLNTTNQIEMDLTEIYCITRALAKLPFLLEDAARGAHVEYDKNMKKLPHVTLNTRLNKRFLDLRTNPTRSIFRIQSAVTLKFTQVLVRSDFLIIHTPKLTSEVSSEGGAEVFKLQYPNGDTAALAQSPQLYKQMSINGGYKRVLEIAPVYRAEKSKTHRHLCEYIGLHAEMEINEHYHEVCDLLGSVFVRVFDHLKEDYQEEINFIREQYPCRDLQYLPKTLMLKYSEGIQMLKDSGFSIEEFDDLNNMTEKKLGKLVFERFGTDFFILYEYPLRLRPFYTMPCAKVDSDADNKYSNSFDAFIRGEEVLSGSQRIHDGIMLLERIKECGLDHKSFSWFLETFKYGAPPRGGFGAGLERFVMLYLGLPEIRMASMFPRDSQRLMP